MTTLYLNVPKDKVDGEGKKSYEDTLKSTAGSGPLFPGSGELWTHRRSCRRSRASISGVCMQAGFMRGSFG